MTSNVSRRKFLGTGGLVLAGSSIISGRVQAAGLPEAPIHVIPETRFGEDGQAAPKDDGLAGKLSDALKGGKGKNRGKKRR